MLKIIYMASKSYHRYLSQIIGCHLPRTFKTGEL
ncbi:Uncharacterised protein [Streptococcus pneumoniae]|nr:Uncharacterised protein [Streptococcus pneumoniae]CIS38645.1 Uncharacterised protein [Streptococcus pneumoniae]